MLVVTSELCVVSADIPVTFPACESRVCVIVTIVDDTSVENTETVNIALERPEDLDSRIRIGTGRGQIIIADDSTDGMCVCVYMCVKCSVSRYFLQRLWFVLWKEGTQLKRGQMGWLKCALKWIPPVNVPSPLPSLLD